MKPDSMTRRQALSFLTAAAPMAAAWPGQTALSAARVAGANERIRLGLIGGGTRGSGLMSRVLKGAGEGRNFEFMAACDVYDRHRQRAADIAGLSSNSLYLDYRELLARRDLDAVMISTPDHWHARMALDAMAAGKDVYVEKPVSLTIPEARAVAEAAHRLGRVLQVGAQLVTEPLHKQARAVVESGEIGDLVWAQATYSRNALAGMWAYYVDPEATPQTVDWNRWLGSAPKRPFSGERLFRWRKYWDYSGGIATDLFYHRLSTLLMVMGPQFPVRVSGAGGIFVHKNSEVPDTYGTMIEYPNFYINISASGANAAAERFLPVVIYGNKGSIVYDRTHITVVPEPVHAGSSAKERVIECAPVDANLAHFSDFLDCIRSRKQPGVNAEFGYQLMVALKLGVDSYREGRLKLFDARTQKILDKAPARATYEGDGSNLGLPVPK